MKQTEDGKRWQKRYLVASGPRVWYFGKPGEPPSKARDVFNMKRALEIKEAVGCKAAEAGFSIALPARTFVFAVEAAAERDTWLEALRACQHHQPPQGSADEEGHAEDGKVEMPALEMGNEKEDEILWVDEYDDFPQGIQKVIRKSKIPEEDVKTHMHVVLNVVRFLYKKRHLKTHLPNPYAGEEWTKPEGQEARDKALFEEAESMYDEITPKTRKKHFKMLKELGKGGFGVVHLAQWTDDKEQVAVKVMGHSTSRDQRANLREIFWLTRLDHKNVVKMKHSFLCLDEMWVVLEYMEGGTLTEAVKTSRFRETEVAYVAREIFSGVSFMHENFVIHRDLKSANVMMTVKAEVKLIDFGLCGDARHSPLLKGMVGSPYWMPPEMIRGQPHSYPVDVWSAGVCLLELCNGHAPKMGNAFRSMFSTGSGQVPPLKKPDQWSMTMQEFFSKMLEIDAKTRFTPDELLGHEFLKNNVASRADMRKKLTEIFQAGAIVAAGFG